MIMKSFAFFRHCGEKFLFLIIIVYIVFSVPCQAQVEIWGQTTEGGEFDMGCIFKTDDEGNNFSIVTSFDEFTETEIVFSEDTGFFDSSILIDAGNGKLFGLAYITIQTQYAGPKDHKVVLYEFDPATPEFKIKKVLWEGWGFPF